MVPLKIKNNANNKKKKNETKKKKKKRKKRGANGPAQRADRLWVSPGATRNGREIVPAVDVRSFGSFLHE